MTELKRVFHAEFIPFPEGEERWKLMAEKVTCTRSEPSRFTVHRQSENGWFAYRPASDRHLQSLSYRTDIIGLRI